MTNPEIKYLKDFFDDYKNRLGTDGCNDFDLPNTPENIELLKAAHLWNVNGDQKAYESDYADWIADYEKNPDQHKKIYTNNIIIFGYLSSKLIKQLTAQNFDLTEGNKK